MFCTQCGKQLNPNQKFCTSCGSPVEDAAPGSVAQANASVPQRMAARQPVLRSSPVRAEAPVVAGTIAEPAPEQVLKPVEVPSRHEESSQKAARRPAIPLFLWGGIAVILVVVVALGLYLHRPHASVPDVKIQGLIQSKFAADPNLRQCTIAVSSRDGVVTLTGSINNDSDRSTAVRIAGQEPGIKQIVDNLGIAQLKPPSGTSATGAKVVQATVQNQATSLELPLGQMYIYGMETGGAFLSSPFAQGQYAQVVNTAGNLSAALAYGASNRNSYNTQTAYHTIGGVSVAGSWDDFTPYYALNPVNAAHDASVSFQVNKDSLVVVFALAADQQVVNVEGVPGLQIDATGGGEWIAHAYLAPGTYTAVEHSRVAADGQDPAHMTDLLGVFVFRGGTAGSETVKASPEDKQNTPTGAEASNPVPEKPDARRRDNRTTDDSSLIARLRSVVTGRGFEPIKQQTWIINADENGNKLLILRAVCRNSADGRCQKLFIAFNDRFLGTDTFQPSWSVHNVVQDGIGRFTALYEDFSDMRHIPPSTKVTYVWDGKRISASGTPPTRPGVP
jgi:hypothetical protein